MADRSDTIPEKATEGLSFTLKDETGALIPGSSLTTFTVTLYDLATGVIVNARDHVDMKANVNGSGLMLWSGTSPVRWQPADAPILNDTLAFETHVALFEWTYNSGLSAGKYEWALVVRNIAKVT